MPSLETELTPLDLSLCILKTVHDCEEKRDKDEVNYSEVFVKGLEEFVKNVDPKFVNELTDNVMRIILADLSEEDLRNLARGS